MTADQFPRLSNRMRAHVAFARFANDHSIDPFDLAHLLTLAARAFNAGEREANTGASADPARRRFEDKAKALRFGVSWPGLLPMLTRAGRSIHLPAV